VKVTGVNPGVPNIRLSGNSQLNHMESVSMMYEKITWKYVDGNILYTDAWTERNTA